MDSIIHERKNNIHWVVLNCPPSNALAFSSLMYLQDVLDEVEEDKEAQCLVIASCTNDFCVGANVIDTQSYWATGAKGVLSKLESLIKPSLVAVNGHANGFGFALALSCDYRYAGSDASFVTSDKAFNFANDCQYGWNLSRSIRNFNLANVQNRDSWTAKEALELGIVSDVFDNDLLIDRVEEIAISLPVPG